MSLLKRRKIKILVESGLIEGTVREANVGEYTQFAKLIVNFIELSGVTNNANTTENVIDVLADLIKDAPEVLGMVDYMCLLTYTEDGNSKSATSITLSDLSMDQIALVLEEVKEVNSAFLGKLMQKVEGMGLVQDKPSQEDTSTQ